MPRDDDRVARAREKLIDQLADSAPLLPGGIVERRTRCGKQGCRCTADPPMLHGPYHQWGYTKGAKRYTRWLNKEQVERYRPGIERGQRFMQLLAELDDAELSRVERSERWGV